MSVHIKFRSPIERTESVIEIPQRTEIQVSALDAYLNDVNVRLAALPDDVRSDVICELRQHLESSIAARIELGDEQEEAATAAIRQFGEPSVIARRFRKAWTTTDSESIWPAAWTSAVLFGSVGLTYALIATAAFTPGATSAASVLCGFGMFVIPALGGVYLGVKFPRRGGLGALYALAALVMPALIVCDWANYIGRPGHSTHFLFVPHELIGAWYVWQFASILLSMCVLWPAIGCASATLAGMNSKRKKSGAKA